MYSTSAGSQVSTAMIWQEVFTKVICHSRYIRVRQEHAREDACQAVSPGKELTSGVDAGSNAVYLCQRCTATIEEKHKAIRLMITTEDNPRNDWYHTAVEFNKPAGVMAELLAIIHQPDAIIADLETEMMWRREPLNEYKVGTIHIVCVACAETIMEFEDMKLENGRWEQIARLTWCADHHNEAVTHGDYTAKDWKTDDVSDYYDKDVIEVCRPMRAAGSDEGRNVETDETTHACNRVSTPQHSGSSRLLLLLLLLSCLLQLDPEAYDS